MRQQRGRPLSLTTAKRDTLEIDQLAARFDDCLERLRGYGRARDHTKPAVVTAGQIRCGVLFALEATITFGLS